MDAHFATAQSSPPTAASVAVLLSGTMRGFREGCIASLREHVVQPNAQHGVAIYLATYTETDCGKKVRSMRREGALTGVSLRDGVTVLPIKSLRASDINATYILTSPPSGPRRSLWNNYDSNDISSQAKEAVSDAAGNGISIEF